MAESYVALLRGINLGGKNKLPMRELVKLCEELGAREVRTYIQSGNVVFACAPAKAKRFGDALSALIGERFGLTVPVVTRTGAELVAVAKSNPWLRKGAELKTLHVGFLAHEPAEDRVALLDPSRSPPDEFVLRGREIYLRLPNGVARSKLTNAYFDSKLATVSTFRNWQTVLALKEMV